MKTTRGGFITSAGMAALSAVLPSIAFPAVVKRRKPNELLSHAAIGCAHQAGYDLSQLASHKELNVTAICDVDEVFLERVRSRCSRRRATRLTR